MTSSPSPTAARAGGSGRAVRWPRPKRRGVIVTYCGGGGCAASWGGACAGTHANAKEAATRVDDKCRGVTAGRFATAVPARAV